MPLVVTPQGRHWAPPRATRLYHPHGSLQMHMLGMGRTLLAWLVACLVQWGVLAMAQRGSSRQARLHSAQQPWWLRQLLQPQLQRVLLLFKSSDSRRSWVDSMDRWVATSSSLAEATGFPRNEVLRMVVQLEARWGARWGA